MHPIAFQIGGFAIRWYGVMAALGFVAATFLIQWNRKYARVNSDQATTLMLLALFGGMRKAQYKKRTGGKTKWKRKTSWN